MCPKQENTGSRNVGTTGVKGIPLFRYFSSFLSFGTVHNILLLSLSARLQYSESSKFSGPLRLFEGDL